MIKFKEKIEPFLICGFDIIKCKILFQIYNIISNFVWINFPKLKLSCTIIYNQTIYINNKFSKFLILFVSQKKKKKVLNIKSLNPKGNLRIFLGQFNILKILLFN